MVTIRIPAPSSMAVVNLLGVFGLLAIVGAIGGLAGWLWALGVAGLFMVTMSVIAATHVAVEQSKPAATVSSVPRSA